MAHRMIDRHLIARTAGHGLELMPQRVERKSLTMQPQPNEQLAELSRQRAVAVVLGPRFATLRQEYQFAKSIVAGRRSFCNCLADCLNRRGPQLGPAGDTRFHARESEPREF